MAYYDIAETADLGCQYNLIFGERSDGKTTAGLIKIVKGYTDGLDGLGRGVYILQQGVYL